MAEEATDAPALKAPPVSAKRIWSDLHSKNGDLEVLDRNMKWRFGYR